MKSGDPETVLAEDKMKEQFKKVEAGKYNLDDMFKTDLEKQERI